MRKGLKRMSHNDGMLSQEEIDALLGGASLANTADDGSEEAYLTHMEMDAIGEIGNISFGSASTALSTLLNQKVEITTPTVSIIKKENFKEEFPYPHVSVRVEYTEGFKGENVLLIKEQDAGIIADLMLGGNGTPAAEINEIHLSAVQEAMNQMMGSSATSMSMMLDKKIDISPPQIEILNVQEDKGTEQIPDEDVFVKVSFKLKVGDLIDSNIMQLMPIDFCKELVNTMVINDSDINHDPSATEHEKASSPETHSQAVEGQSEPVSEASIVPDAQASSKGTNRLTQSSSVRVQPAAFSEFQTLDTSFTASNNIDLLLDIPLTVTVELGRTKKTIKDILDLSPGAVVELDKLAGEPVDVLINHKPIAKGEVVVIDENFGVRITEIINKRDRLEKLN